MHLEVVVFEGHVIKRRKPNSLVLEFGIESQWCLIVYRDNGIGFPFNGHYLKPALECLKLVLSLVKGINPAVIGIVETVHNRIIEYAARKPERLLYELIGIVTLPEYRLR
jgi:hypothetical protein